MTAPQAPRDGAAVEFHGVAFSYADAEGNLFEPVLKGVSLSVAVAAANGLAMVRVLTGIPILWFLVPGYAVALGLSFFVPRTFTAIAFDSGGVASGPMTATFMLQFVMGASSALGGNILRDAFGVVALVAMMPLLSIQAVGFVYERRAKRTAAAPEQYGDFDIVELWEDAA